MQLKGKRQTQQRLPKCLTGIVVLYVGCFALLHRTPTKEEKTPTTPIEKEEPPGFVRAFLERRADWHDLFHDWQALGVDDPVAREAIRARQLETVLPPARAYGVDHGGLRGAAACALLRDKCAVHAASRCAGDELCAYDADRGLCVRRATNGTAACPAGTAAEQLVGGRWTRASSCGVAVTADVVGPLAVPGDAKMLYHWYAWFEATLLPRRNLAAPPHVIFRDGAAPVAAFAPWLGALGGNCARAESDAAWAAACACRARGAARPPRPPPVVDALRSAAGLPPLGAAPRGATKTVCLLSRRRKRFVLNEAALLAEAEALGHRAVALPLELMTTKEQLDALGRCDVLAGVHGSGLNNVAFLPRRGDDVCVVQLLPYLVGERYVGALPRRGTGALFFARFAPGHGKTSDPR